MRYFILADNFTRAEVNIVTTMTKIVIVICNASDERFGLLYEDTGV